jgi:hypothetical protein
VTTRSGGNLHGSRGSHPDWGVTVSVD